ncbi:hypothetical protein LAZ67_15000825 [Cordylochernes scorpioides]|uniref:Transposase n=1 Tax=Cordylochernes scorpioides TaxID=51811 RepID=A0ABY6LCG1_9ARAC|nr:hypothetical protein LAZ67_15000825 [Cordylochernes scorpioides]
MKSVKDEKRVGRPILHRNPEKGSQISNLIKENPRIGLRDIEEETGISKSLVGSIIKEDLQLNKTPSNFVPKMLTIQQKENRVEVAKKVLEMKQNANPWSGKEKNEPRTKKSRLCNSKNKVLLVTFFDIKKIVHHEYLEEGQAINKESYLNIMRRVRESIRLKISETWSSKNYIIHHDNAPPHTATSVLTYLAKQGIQILQQPPYPPDLAPNDFILFPKLKMALKGRRFDTRECIIADSKKVLKKIPKDAFSKCFKSWEKRPVTATDNAAVAAVRNVVEADRRVTIDEIMIRLPPGIEIGRSSKITIMSDVLNFRKVCARWVPRLVSENHKQQRMEAARAFLEMNRRDGDQLFSCIVTGDEIWVHHSTPETKRQSMVWKKPEESAPKRRRYCEVLTKLSAAIKRKRSGLLSRKVLLVHDNARPSAARTTQALLENFKWKILTNPHYSPELSPSNFHLFPALKLHLGVKHFANDDEVQAEANNWLRRQDTAWYNSGINNLLQRYQKCLDRNGDYVEK